MPKKAKILNENDAGFSGIQNYFSVTGYAGYIKRKISFPTAVLLGKRAARLCYDNGFLTGSVPDARYGRVKTYPADVLERVFTNYFNAV